jgi:hypothetical protein
MTKLLEKEAKFKWSPPCEEAFLTLKKLLTLRWCCLNLTLRSCLIYIVMHLTRVLEEY